MSQIEIDFIPYRDLAERAQVFLSQYDLADKLPVPIEEVIDFKLDYDIVPIPNMQRDFDVEAFTSFQSKAIYVDGFVFQNRHTRYRYSLAHEVGHIYLHKNILGPFQFDSVVDWAEFIDRMDGSVHSKLEYQGYSFGGLVLVPPRPLAEKVKLHISDIEPLVRKAQESGIRKSAYIGNAIDSLSSILAPMFDVSQEVIIKRIELDKLERLIP